MRRFNDADERARDEDVIVDCFSALEALDGKEYLVGGRFSVADLIAAQVVSFARKLGLADGLPSIAAYLERIEEGRAVARSSGSGAEIAPRLVVAARATARRPWSRPAGGGAGVRGTGGVRAVAAWAGSRYLDFSFGSRERGPELSS